MKITFVCTGNTCRSPMLQAMFADYARKVGFECETDSAGVCGGGSPVNPKTVNVLAARGIKAEGESKLFDDRLAAESDYVFTMSESQRDDLKKRYPTLCVECLSALCGHEIDDPYGKGQEDYDATGELFEDLLAPVLEFVEAAEKKKTSPDKKD